MKRTALLLTLGLLVACGGGGSTPPPAPEPDFELALSTGATTVVQGENTELTVNITPKNGFTGDVTYTLTQPSADKVGFTFTPLSKTQAKLGLSAPMAMPLNTYTMYVNASSGSLNKSQELKVTVTKSPLISVGGKIRNVLGGLVKNATVKITTSDGKTLSGTSDTDGKFKVDGVLAPYTARVEIAGGESHTFPGLNRPDPTLRLFTGNGILSFTDVTLSGTLSGGSGFPNPPGTITQVLYTSLYENLGGQTLLPGQGPAYSVSAKQFDEKYAAGRLWALQWEANIVGDNKIPVKYTGFGATLPFVTSGTSVTRNIALSPVGQSVVSGEVLPHPTMKVLWKALGAALLPRGGFVLASDKTNSLNFTYPVPDVAQLNNKFVLAVGAESPEGNFLILNRAGLGGGQTEKFTLQTPPSLTEPANGAVGNITTLKWNKGTLSQPFFILMYQVGVGPGQFVYTTSNSFEGTFAKSSSFNWMVTAVSNFATADAFTDPGVWTFGYPNPGSALDYEVAWTKAHNFKTSP